METQNLIREALARPETLDVVRELALAATHRTALAEQLCERFAFRDARGRLQTATCRNALRALERTGTVTLPASRSAPGDRSVPLGLQAPVPAPAPLPSHVVHVGRIELVVVGPEDDELRRVWTELLRREHPLGAPRLAGYQLRYLVRSAHGWIGALGFAAAALKLAPRERWLGWNDATRKAMLHRVVGLSRFLIRPGTECANLASTVLGLALRALPLDFEARYQFRPWLVETFNDPLVHSGTCYRATNWEYLGTTTGRGRQDRMRTATAHAKEIYVHVLEPRLRERIAQASARAALAPREVHAGLDSEQWAQAEFGDAPIGDRRLGARLVSSAALTATSPGQAFSSLVRGDRAAAKGYYRLIDQPDEGEVTPDNMLAPHRMRTIERMQAQPTALCVQDGTDFNFTRHVHCTGLGVIGTNQTGAEARGLHLHSTYALSHEGLPLGLLKAQFEAPVRVDVEADGAGVGRRRKSERWLDGYRDCAELATRCPDTQMVSVCDREADLFALFDLQRRDPRAELLVRAKSDRRLVFDPPPGSTDTPAPGLFDFMRGAAERGRVVVGVGRQSKRPKSARQQPKDKRPERLADVSVHFERVTVRPPARCNAPGGPLTLGCIHVREDAPAEGTKPLEWCLLTTLAVESLDDAQRILQWYCLRWRIEDWHRVIKSGCQVEKMGHDSAERLSRAIAIRLVVAWRVQLLTLLGREVPELPAQLLFSDLELEVLSAWNSTLGKPRTVPKLLGDAIRLVAMLGGYLARNNDGPPGTKVLWTGMMTLGGMALGYRLNQIMASRESEP